MQEFKKKMKANKKRSKKTSKRVPKFKIEEMDVTDKVYFHIPCSNEEDNDAKKLFIRIPEQFHRSHVVIIDEPKEGERKTFNDYLQETVFIMLASSRENSGGPKCHYVKTSDVPKIYNFDSVKVEVVDTSRTFKHYLKKLTKLTLSGGTKIRIDSYKFYRSVGVNFFKKNFKFQKLRENDFQSINEKFSICGKKIIGIIIRRELSQNELLEIYENNFENATISILDD